MANRWFAQFRYSLEKYVVDLYAHATLDGSGVATLDQASSKGIRSMTRTGTGTYDVVLQDSYYRFLMANSTFLGAASPAPHMRVAAQTVGSLPSPTITLQFTNPAGAAADPSSSEVYLQFSLSNTSAI